MSFTKTKTLSLILLLFLSLPQMYGQTEEKTNIIHLTGRTLTDSLQPVPYVHIILVNKRLGTASDLNGNFNFPAEVNDTILFRAVGFKYSKLIVKDTFMVEFPYIPITMVEDTILLRETRISPWERNYVRFKEAVLAYKLPVTDKDRAEKNLNAMQLRSLLLNAPATPTMGFRNTMNSYNERLYWAGQLPPVTITNPLAWAQFFKALKNGEFKNK